MNDIKKIIEDLTIRLQKPLPGEPAQLRMAPVGRRGTSFYSADFNPRHSAVLIILTPFNDELRLVLIERPSYEGVHSGQIAFPGGSRDDTDPDLEATALREAFEEIGLQARALTVVGELTELYIPPSNFLVKPFVAFCPELPILIPDQREVASILLPDLFHLFNQPATEVEVKLSTGLKIKTPCYMAEGKIVWGATAMILSELQVLFDEITSS